MSTDLTGPVALITGAISGIGTAGGFSGRDDDPETFYSFASYATPPTVYHYNVATGEKKEVFRANVKINPSDYEVKSSGLQGATSGDELAKPNAIKPRRASRSTIQPSTPAEYERVIVSTATPWARTSRSNGSSAASNAGWAKPRLASARTIAPLGSATSGTAVPTTLPHRRCAP